MATDVDTLSQVKRETLGGVALATFLMAAVLLIPTASATRYSLVLIGAWLLFAALIRYVALRPQLSPLFRRPIPIRFAGNLGRFTLLSWGDGRRVEVRAGDEVVAEATATDERDELVVDLGTVDDGELDALGAAIGRAIEMVAVADERLATEQRIAGPGTWVDRPIGANRSTGGPRTSDPRFE
jgi:hypothetical protein